MGNTQNFWDRCAPIYNGVMRPQKKAYENMYEKLRSAVRGLEVLELAAGTGLITQQIAETAAHVTATDLSAPMLGKLREAVGDAENVTVQQEDAEALSFPEASFDVVIIADALHIVAHPEQVLAECARVLKPDGLLIAPCFLCEEGSKPARVAMDLMQKGGFPLQSRWDAEAYAGFLAENGFALSRSALLDGFLPLFYAEFRYDPENAVSRLPHTAAKPDYQNIIPRSTVAGFGAGTAVLGTAAAVSAVCCKSKSGKLLTGMLSAGALACGAAAAWSAYAHSRYSDNCIRRLSAEIVAGTAAYIRLPEGGVGLDVGCGTGALTIACAKNNPQGHMIGVDSFSGTGGKSQEALCKRNADAENVCNVSFMQDNARSLQFPDESFDAVTSNFYYRSFTGVRRQKLLTETLRVLKKGGTFAIHDVMTQASFGDMEAFAEKLRQKGYARVELIRTDTGKFMSRRESALLMLRGSCLLVGEK